MASRADNLEEIEYKNVHIKTEVQGDIRSEEIKIDLYPTR